MRPRTAPSCSFTTIAESSPDSADLAIRLPWIDASRLFPKAQGVASVSVAGMPIAGNRPTQATKIAQLAPSRSLNRTSNSGLPLSNLDPANSDEELESCIRRHGSLLGGSSERV